MEDFKEFEAKSIDEAIDEACRHFDADREQLELEIVSDAKGGIFGLMGARKAVVRARRRDNLAELKGIVTQVVERLLEPITDTAKLFVVVEEADRVKVEIEDEEHSGLLIGREGQTLSALQYLSNRIVNRRWREPVRVQLDTGDYRERQDENLRQLAGELADKAEEAGKPQSTRPLSSYHRRVVHLALQEREGVQTRSKGDGPLKRVLILPAKKGGGGGRPRGKRGGRGRNNRGRQQGSGQADAGNQPLRESGGEAQGNE
jgi:spoIIIJ-associated protein